MDSLPLPPQWERVPRTLLRKGAGRVRVLKECHLILRFYNFFL